MVAKHARSATRRLSDGSAVFFPPVAEVSVHLTLNPSAQPVPLVLASPAATSATVITITGAGGKIDGTVPRGARFTLGAEEVTAAESVNCTLGRAAVKLTAPLVGSHDAGDTVAHIAGPVSFPVSHVVTISHQIDPADPISAGLTFAFQYNYQAAGFVPEHNWNVTRTTTAGSKSGTVKRVVFSGVQVLVYVGE